MKEKLKEFISVYFSVSRKDFCEKKVNYQRK